VLGRDPWTAREQLMRDVSFIADVAVLPRWIRVSRCSTTSQVSSAFDPRKSRKFSGETEIKRREQSQGIIQGNGCAVASSDRDGHRLRDWLVLDEPTLGLDFYIGNSLRLTAERYFDRTRTILVTTHQVEEVQDCPHRLISSTTVASCSMQHGRIRVALSGSDGESRECRRSKGMQAIHERQVFGRSVLLFDHVDRDQLAALGEVAGLALRLVRCRDGPRTGDREVKSQRTEEADEHFIKRRAEIWPSFPASRPGYHNSLTRPWYWSGVA